MNCISRNCLLLVVLTCLFPFFVFAEIPAGYYDDAVGKSGEDLQKSLSTILNDATDVGYDGLWNLYKTTDRRSDGKVWDMYSDVTNYTLEPINVVHTGLKAIAIIGSTRFLKAGLVSDRL